jgi:hypothetical protein
LTKLKDAFPESLVEAMNKAKSIGVRAGTEHRYTSVWVVVVERRVFVRSWNDKPTGWFRAFKQQPEGNIRIGKIEVPVSARVPRTAHIRNAVTEALREKYNNKGALKWATGFAEPSRVLTTLEFVPQISQDRSC